MRTYIKQVFGNVNENKCNLFQWPVLHVEQSNVWASKSVFGHASALMIAMRADAMSGGYWGCHDISSVL